LVNRVLGGMPAESAGLRPGDRLLAIDGKSAAGLSQGSRSYLLKGKPGTPVTIDVQSGAQQRRVTLTRKAAPTP
jgi:carboxyl-terminal processing protease